MADGGEEGAEVMQSAEEDAAEYAPEEHGHPAKDRGLNRSIDRTGPGDGGEVVSHEDRRFRGDIVHAVFHGMGGGFPVRVNAPFPDQIVSVEDVAHDEQGHSRQDDQERLHTVFLPFFSENLLFQIGSYQFTQFPPLPVAEQALGGEVRRAELIMGPALKSKEITAVTAQFRNKRGGFRRDLFR